MYIHLQISYIYFDYLFSATFINDKLFFFFGLPLYIGKINTDLYPLHLFMLFNRYQFLTILHYSFLWPNMQKVKHQRCDLTKICQLIKNNTFVTENLCDWICLNNPCPAIIKLFQAVFNNQPNKIFSGFSWKSYQGPSESNFRYLDKFIVHFSNPCFYVFPFYREILSLSRNSFLKIIFVIKQYTKFNLVTLLF